MPLKFIPQGTSNTAHGTGNTITAGASSLALPHIGGGKYA